MKTQIIKDTAEYNYNLGYLKAIEEVEKMIEKQIIADDYMSIDTKQAMKEFKQQLQEMKEKK